MPSLPLSVNPAASGVPAVFASGSVVFASGLAAAPSSPELELLLELLPSAPALAFGVSLTPSFPSSPGNGNCAAVFAAEPAPEAALEAAPAAAPEAALAVAPAASGACGPPLSVAGSAYGVSNAPPSLASPGNGNCWVALCFPGSAVFVPHGTGCGATEHGAGLAAGAGEGIVPAAGVGAGTAAGVLCAPHATAAHAIHAPATNAIPELLRISFPFPLSLDGPPRPNVFATDPANPLAPIAIQMSTTDRHGFLRIEFCFS